MRNDQVFYLKFLLPFLALVMTYVIVEQSYMAALNESDLMTVSGKVFSIKQGKHKLYRSITERITISLDKPNHQHYYIEDNTDLFPTIINEIKTGDTISLYHRTKMQTKIGLGNEFEILKIQKGTENVYRLETAKQPLRSLRNYLLLPALMLWIFYFYFRKRIAQKNERT